MKRYLSAKETVAELGVHRNTLTNWRKKGILKPKKIGHRVFYRIEDIEAAMQDV